MTFLHFSFECETRTIKCNADERRRQLDEGEPLFASTGTEANESRHSNQIKGTTIAVPLIIYLNFKK